MSISWPKDTQSQSVAVLLTVWDTRIPALARTPGKEHVFGVLDPGSHLNSKTQFFMSIVILLSTRLHAFSNLAIGFEVRASKIALQEQSSPSS